MNTVENLRKHSRAFVRHFGFFRNYYEDTNATYSETHALVELDRFGALEVGELARILNVDKTGASKILANMRKKGWVKPQKATDARKKIYTLTAAGKKFTQKLEYVANDKVERALEELNTEEQRAVLEGMELFVTALRRSRARKEFVVRPCESRDNKQIASIVRRAMKDLGVDLPGTVVDDPTLDVLSTFNNGPQQCYLIAEKDGKVYGGAGIMPLAGESADVCELVRMFLHPDARGTGLSQLLMEQTLTRAKEFGYKTCYLETTERMHAAQNLYLQYGFDYVKQRRGNTGHFGCKVLMEKKL